MKRLIWIALAACLVLLPACGQTPAANVAAPGATSGNADSIDEAYRLILQNSVQPVNAETLANAGVSGLRTALLQDGVTPDVPVPAFTPDPSQDLVLLHGSVQSVANRYSSKLTARQVDDAVINAMADSVGDCHTAYFTPQQFSQQIAWIQGQAEFGGIGASLRKTKANEPLVIWRVFEGSPAAKAGLKDGDVIKAVDGTDVSSFSVQMVVNLIRGPVGQTVQLTIQPAGQQGFRSVTIRRGQIQPPSVEARMLPGQIGYVELYSFPENAAAQLKVALDALDRQGARAWVIDVRDNGGGALDAVTQSLSLFVPKGTVLFYAYGSDQHRTDYTASGSNRSRVPPMAILTNDGTGSGGELFAAVLREAGLATVVGGRTAGCVGTGQLFPLPGGAGIQVTVAQLITARGKVLNQVGVTPDVSIDMSVQDLIAGHDPQLDRAVQALQVGA
jgi:carboxyl-terminal processing protease